MPSPTEPRPIATFAHAVPLDWMPCSASLASTCLSISELILSTSPSATAPSYARPSSVCTAAAAATSSCARSSIKPSYIAIVRPDNELCCHGECPLGNVRLPALTRRGPERSEHAVGVGRALGHVLDDVPVLDDLAVLQAEVVRQRA